MNVFRLKNNVVKAKTVKPLVYYVWGEEKTVKIGQVILVDKASNIALIDEHHIEIFPHEFEELN